MRILGATICLALALLAWPTLVQAEHPAPGPAIDPQRVLLSLMAGNRRFATGHAVHPHAERARIRETGWHGQHPQAVVLACADSRVCPEILFDQGVGDLFTIRVAGNVGNEDEAASVEYAADHLEVPVCVVLGHTGCGAVTAVVRKEPLHGSFDHLLAHTREAVGALRKKRPDLTGTALLDEAVRANIWEAIEDLLQESPALVERARTGKLRIVGAVYDTRSGKVHWMGRHPRENALLKEQAGKRPG